MFGLNIPEPAGASSLGSLCGMLLPGLKNGQKMAICRDYGQGLDVQAECSHVCTGALCGAEKSHRPIEWGVSMSTNSPISLYNFLWTLVVH